MGQGNNKCNKKNSAVFFLLQFLVIKSLDPEPNPDSVEMVDPGPYPDPYTDPYPDPDSMNPDPQHCCGHQFSSKVDKVSKFGSNRRLI